MTFSEIAAQVAQWLNRSDMTAVIPQFIELAEEKLNRQLRVRNMELALVSTPIVDNKISLPATAIDVKVIWSDSYPDHPLKPQALESVIGSGDGAYPSMYAFTGSQIQFNGGGSVSGVLFQRIPALQTNETNWLSTSAPSAYLFGALAEAMLYMGGDASVWSQRFVNVIDELNGNDKRYNGPLVARAR